MSNAELTLPQPQIVDNRITHAKARITHFETLAETATEQWRQHWLNQAHSWRLYLRSIEAGK